MTDAPARIRAQTLALYRRYVADTGHIPHVGHSWSYGCVEAHCYPTSYRPDVDPALYGARPLRVVRPDGEEQR